MPSADFCRPVRIDYSTPSPEIQNQRQISRGKFDRLPYTTAGSTTGAFDGSGLRGCEPTRPAPYASYPFLVHRPVRLLHASFRPRLAAAPLRFAITSPPSGCEKDFHLRAVEHARHTRGRDDHRWPPPAQIRTSGLTHTSLTLDGGRRSAAGDKDATPVEQESSDQEAAYAAATAPTHVDCGGPRRPATIAATDA